MADELDFRSLRPDELEALFRVDTIAFHGPERAGELDGLRAVFEFDRSVGAYDGKELVGTAAVFTQRLSVPGGELPCAGVTAVGVLPTHRRRGMLTRMMGSLLAQARERGEPLAALWASEGAIYGRFGFAPATQGADLRIDLRRPIDFQRGPAAGSVRLAALDDEALGRLRPVFERVRAVRQGLASRSDARWRSEVIADPEDLRDDYGPKRLALIDDGYAIYRTKEADEVGELKVIELAAATPAAYAGLWRYLCSIDLLAAIEAPLRPVDEPLPLLLADPSAVAVTQVYDALWLRLLDVPAALRGRGWAAETSVVLEVADAGVPENAGTWTLETGRDGGRCERSDEPAELVLDVRDLAAAYLGATPVARLVAAGIVEERAPGAAARLDAALRTSAAPWTAEVF